MDIPALLDAAKKAQGFETDMALAKALGISRSAVSAWRNGQKAPDPVQSAALAGYTGIPLAKVLGIVGEARAISAKEKAVWRKLASTAAVVAVGLLSAYLGHSGGHDGGWMAFLPFVAVTADPVCIMRNAAWVALAATLLLQTHSGRYLVQILSDWLAHVLRRRKPSPENVEVSEWI